ncbi:hypothetical protein ACTXMW_09530 [Brachybacterium paraconglomeratum]|uniref:hypothetical protein n=1 Tax=Brachybacterium paraconglomeratum TaxID=173362 RepID=UPI003FD0E283
MSYGLLLTLVIWAGGIALLLRPPRRPLLLARAVYYLSVALNELPMLVLLLLTLNLAPSLLPSDDGPALGPLAAAAGITLGLFVLLGLMLIQRRISRSRAVILRIVGRPAGRTPSAGPGWLRCRCARGRSSASRASPTARAGASTAWTCIVAATMRRTPPPRCCCTSTAAGTPPAADTSSPAT